MEALAPVVTVAREGWLFIKSFIVVWMIAVFISVVVWKYMGPRDRDSFLWFMPPFLVGTCVVLPVIYLVASLF